MVEPRPCPRSGGSPESPTRWPVRAFRHDTGRCGSERRGCRRHPCQQGEDPPRELPQPPAEARAQGAEGAQAPEHDSLLRDAPLVASFGRPPARAPSRSFGARSGALRRPRARSATTSGSSSRAAEKRQARRLATAPPRVAICDGLRTLLPTGARRRVVRVRPPDDRAQRPVPGSLPNGRLGAARMPVTATRRTSRRWLRTSSSSSRGVTGVRGAVAGPPTDDRRFRRKERGRRSLRVSFPLSFW